MEASGTEDTFSIKEVISDFMFLECILVGDQ